LELRCTMAVFGNPEGCGDELGKPSLGGDSRRIMHETRGGIRALEHQLVLF